MSASLYTAAQTRDLDRTAIATLGISGFVLMQRAAAAAWRVLKKRWPNARRIVVMCGPGNNGGDGYLLARTAKDAGLDARVIALAKPKESSPDALRAHDEWIASGGKIATSTDPIPDADVYVDALFGTGLQRPSEGFARALIDHVNRYPARVLSLDIPSGIDSDTGNVLRAAVRATATVSFVAHKRGLVHRRRARSSRRTVPRSSWLARRFVRTFRRRRAFARHGSHVALAAAASAQFAQGKVRPRARDRRRSRHVRRNRMAGEAAMRVGSGLTSIATRSDNVSAINAGRPELMAHAVPMRRRCRLCCRPQAVIAVGPGLGQSNWSRSLLTAAIATNRPTVLDADALNHPVAKIFPVAVRSVC